MTPEPRPHVLSTDGCPVCVHTCPCYGTDPTRKGRCARMPFQVIAAEQRLCHPVVARELAALADLRRRAGLLAC